MLRPKRRSALVASASLFAAIYAILGAIPLSKLVGAGFLSASKVVAPLAGMLLGPVTGSLASILGDTIDLSTGFIPQNAFGVPVIFADLAVVVTAGLAFSGRRVASIGLPLALVVAYALDPLSVLFVGPVPFLWLHLVAFVYLGVALFLEKDGRIQRLSPLFVVAVSLAALMCGHLAGTLMGQTLQVRVYGVFTPAVWAANLSNIVFPAYPPERIFFTVLSALVSLPVLRAVKGIREKKSIAS